ncbi:MAG: fimbrillin family protein [Bacteroidaceae bacterium]|nr:fimbrillin family protein [Bacteroidaceae bacterium]
MRVTIKTTAALLMTAAIIGSCTNDSVITEVSQVKKDFNSEIIFGNFVGNSTRASKKSVGEQNFVIGESMAVWGMQFTGAQEDSLFINQKVDYEGNSEWSYQNKKYWNVGSTYAFYGFFPYSKNLYTLGDNFYISVPSYTTPNDPDQQVDLMVAERKVNVSPFNVVDMTFHHILSNVNIYAKIAGNLDMTGIKHIQLSNLEIKGIKSSGSYAQNDWDEMDLPVGAWSNQSGLMSIDPFRMEIHKKADTILNDYLMIPQKLFDLENSANDAHIDVVFRVEYTDGSAATYTKNNIRFAGMVSNANNIISTWEPNYRYNYTLSFNPGASTVIWDADGDGSLIIDPLTGDTLTKTNDTPTPGSMKYDPDDPDNVLVFEDTDGDGKPDTWNKYPIAWENIDDDDMLEAGIDRDGDGKIDNVDGDNITQMGGDNQHDPTDGNANNPGGKDVILVFHDSDGDGVADEWIQIQKDPTNGKIYPERETLNATIEFTAKVTDWNETEVINYEVRREGIIGE